MNRHGLSRDIPGAIKREVRQRCGYGCVICGGAIIEYEHIEPAFSDATAHDPNAIALLCPGCHAKVTRGFMAKSTVREALTHPAAKARGFANEVFDLGRVQPTIVFAGMTLENTPIPILVRGVPLLEIKSAEALDGPFRLSGRFQNSSGELSLEIVDNEWRQQATNWDVEVVGGVITVRDAPRHISLRLRADPPNRLVVERLDMRYAGFHFLGDPDTLEVQFPDGGTMSFTRCITSNARVGLSLG